MATGVVGGWLVDDCHHHSRQIGAFVLEPLICAFSDWHAMSVPCLFFLDGFLDPGEMFFLRTKKRRGFSIYYGFSRQFLTIPLQRESIATNKISWEFALFFLHCFFMFVFTCSLEKSHSANGFECYIVTYLIAK